MTKKKAESACKVVTKRKKSLIGLDPLAWLSEDENAETEPTEKTVAETGQAPQPGNQNCSGNSGELSDELNESTESAIEIPGMVNLGNSLDIQIARTLLEQLKEIPLSEDRVLLDGSEIERADTAGLQLLAAFCQHAETQGVMVEWKQPSEILQKSAATIGLSNHLHLK